MIFSNRLLQILVVAIVVGGVGTVASRWIWPESEAGSKPQAGLISPAAAQGKVAFEAYCAQCHGTNGGGTVKGPPLVNDIYNPGHHADAAFFSAARRGVQQHHWPFGNMPPRPEVSDEEITTIVAYIRGLQEENGIFYRPHNM